MYLQARQIAGGVALLPTAAGRARVKPIRHAAAASIRCASDATQGSWHLKEDGHKGGLQHCVQQSSEFEAYMQIARPINLLPSLLLVVIGALTGSKGRALLTLRSAAVWIVSVISGGVAVASVSVNDYFDRTVDAANAPWKPLPSGLVKPDGVLLLSATIYNAVLIAACFMEPPLLRTIIAASAALTLLYTPLLKQLTWIKNACVAAVVAASPFAGALAARAEPLGLQAVMVPCLFVFGGVFYREILMDLNDSEGDRRNKIWTLPVVFGKRNALFAAMTGFTAATAASLWVALQGSGITWLAQALSLPLGAVQLLAAAAVALAVWPIYAGAATIYSNRFLAEVIGPIIDSTLKPIGLTMLLLAAAA